MRVKLLKTEDLDSYAERTKRNHFWVGGSDGQQKIKNLRIGVAGLGGMGSNIAEIFARLGVGYLRLTDPDIIERSNINRQVIAFENTIGKKKAEASADEIRRIGKDIILDVSTEGIQEHNVDAFVEGLDVVINEIDVLHIDKQILLIEAAHRRGICVYTTLVVGLGIHLYKFDPANKYPAREFLETLVQDKSIKNLVERLGQPLPPYLTGDQLTNFVQHIETQGVPIFGGSTFLGQSLLAIRVLFDRQLIHHGDTSLPETPCLPRFLVLDPLILGFKTAEIKPNGEFIICED